ncbi:protein of unknown function [Methylacidimicrobium sp. AP8]|nr:protein of unknown function [Methylacidimicrobium sp. AP8]
MAVKGSSLRFETENDEVAYLPYLEYRAWVGGIPLPGQKIGNRYFFRIVLRRRQTATVQVSSPPRVLPIGPARKTDEFEDRIEWRGWRPPIEDFGIVVDLGGIFAVYRKQAPAPGLSFPQFLANRIVQISPGGYRQGAGKKTGRAIFPSRRRNPGRTARRRSVAALHPGREDDLQLFLFCGKTTRQNLRLENSRVREETDEARAPAHLRWVLAPAAAFRARLGRQRHRSLRAGLSQCGGGIESGQRRQAAGTGQRGGDPERCGGDQLPRHPGRQQLHGARRRSGLPRAPAGHRLAA